jgi:hypothetical protein
MPFGRPGIMAVSGTKNVVRAGPRLLRVQSERLELPAPFGWRIAQPFDADASRQPTLDRMQSSGDRRRTRPRLPTTPHSQPRDVRPNCRPFLLVRPCYHFGRLRGLGNLRPATMRSIDRSTALSRKKNRPPARCSKGSKSGASSLKMTTEEGGTPNVGPRRSVSTRCAGCPEMRADLGRNHVCGWILSSLVALNRSSVLLNFVQIPILERLQS